MIQPFRTPSETASRTYSGSKIPSSVVLADDHVDIGLLTAGVA
jgi:hypothetical protein